MKLLKNMGVLREFLFPMYRVGGRWGSLIEGRSVYALKINQFRPDTTKLGPTLAQNRNLRDMFGVKCSHEFAETNASAPTVQLRSIRVVLAVINCVRKVEF